MTLELRWESLGHRNILPARLDLAQRTSTEPAADPTDDVPSDAVPFDMRGVELSHHSGDCTFETVLRHYGLDDPVLWEIAQVVHEADLADDRFDEPAAPGLDAICRGLTFVADDERVLEVSAVIFDGLYEQRRRSLLGGAR
ncbi:MAG: chromate resistance protein ChrB domain-containing protein [Actinomycetota bacterium]